jgi:hypothetical protein
MQTEINKTRGLVATVTSGDVKPQYAQSLSDMRAYNITNGITNVEYKTFYATLVERGRDDAVMHAIKNNYDWLLQIDADAVVPAQTLAMLFDTMVQTNADVVGAYSQLKGKPHRPTIDTGTGTWENWAPGNGVLEVIRTGGHCLMTSVDLHKRMGPPWFRSRTPKPILQSFREVDNHMRCKFDGVNPLQDGSWEEGIRTAMSDAVPPVHAVGEDSAFCDRVKAMGGKIVVNTDVVTGHVTNHTITYKDFADQYAKDVRAMLASYGILTT